LDAAMSRGTGVEVVRKIRHAQKDRGEKKWAREEKIKQFLSPPPSFV